MTDKGDGKYTFTMPASKVAIDLEFKEIGSDQHVTPVTPTVNFNDVPSGAYYADAVSWAVENCITTDTSADTFTPNNPFYRARR